MLLHRDVVMDTDERMAWRADVAVVGRVGREAFTIPTTSPFTLGCALMEGKTPRSMQVR